jgi:hypothetical protein
MMTRTVRGRNSNLLLITLLMGMVACRKVEPPARPASVPAEAVWAGGADGGSWILCSVDAENNVNRCTIYNDNSGEIELQGDFTLRGESRAARVEELSYVGFDGSVIGLAGNRVLELKQKVPAMK